ncbi:AAA family ATPase [Aquiflexum sp. LQ15W]|uniref:AAA family ATPase n=1 Tax=Cognataquiflexum nitidum TaxID=2922272 RepID=UPI001F137E8F|nr:ATP-binding protein [Cognataquiflexum nitidum]MCH6199869.1 AAA family ATPase [Cognataquiflexum nitidum]
MMKSPGNPFVLNTYHGKKYFCDRENDIEVLRNHIDNDRNVVLFAWRRLGKSALIQRFFEELEDSGEFETLYVDLLATHSIEEAIKAITTVTYDKYGKTHSGFSATMQKLFSALGATISFNPLSGIPELSIGIKQPGMEDHSLNALGVFLQERKKRIVITIDEFQQISHYAEKNAEAVFRTWVQLFPDIRFIFSGSHRTMMVEMFAENSRPFYQSAQLMSLLPIALEKYTPFIQGHFEDNGKTISAELIEKIYAWARGQTYTIQLICNYLFAQFNHVEEEDFHKICSDILEQHQAIFANFPKMLTRTQWNVFKAIAKEEPLFSPLNKDFLTKHRLGAASSVSTALKALQKQELVVVDEGVYLVHEVLLARWMARL